MRDRLIAVLKKAPLCNKVFDLQYSDSTIEKIADKILADGWMRFPFNLGANVFVIDRGCRVWWQGTVSGIYYAWNEIIYGISFSDGDFATYNQEDIYASREEAEKALRKEDEGK